MEWADAIKVILSGRRWVRYTELRMGAGANMSVSRMRDDLGRTVYRAAAAWDNWSLFKMTGDHGNGDDVLAGVDSFAIAMVDLLARRAPRKG